MQRKTVVGVSVVAVLVLAFAGYRFGLRDRGGGGAEQQQAASGGDDPWAKAPRDRKPDVEEPASRGGERGMPRLSFETDPSGTFVLEGQVLDEDDQAVAGATVRISSSPPRTTTTNATGEFSFDKLLGRTYRVSARSGDKVGGPITVKGSTRDPVVIRLRPGAVLTVTVTDATAKKPVAGAKVALLDDDEREETTGGDGVASFRALDPGWTQVAVSASGYSPGTAVARVGSGEQTAKVAIALVRGAPVSGRVVDEQGQPIGGAQVWAVDAANAWVAGGGERFAVTSGKDGTFTIPALAAGSWILRAKDEDHAPSSTRPITVNGEVATTGVEIVLPTAAVVAGVVVDGEGKPVADASVQVASDRWSPDMVYRQAAADSEGRFEVRALPRRTFKVRATSEEASSDPVAVDLTGVAEKRDVKLIVDRTGTIAGVVVDSAGEAVAEAEVSATPDFLSAGRQDSDWILAAGDNAITDGDGRFVLRGLEDGSYRLFAERDAGGVRRTASRMGVVAKVGDQDVRLVLPAPGSIVGKVVLEGGGPPANATITAGWENRTTTTDGDFRLGEVQPATYDVRVSGGEFSEQVRRDVVVKAGEEIDLGTIVVRPGRKVAGKVVDGKGARVEGARVYMGQLLFGDGKRVGSGDDATEQPGTRQTTTNAAGEFVVVGAPRTGGALIASHEARGRSVSIEVPPGKDDVRGLELRLLGYGSIAGKVTRKGEPVPGATVSAAPFGASGQASLVTAGVDGNFVIDRVPAGRTNLLAMASQMMRASSGGREVVVEEGKQVDGSIELPVGDIKLTVQVKALPGATVNLAQLFLFHGRVNASTGLEVSNLFFARRGVQAQPGMDLSDVGVAAGMTFWFGTGDPTFDEIAAGPYTLCAIPITGQFADQQAMERIMRNLHKLLAVCKPVAIAASPQAQTVVMELPTMPPLSPDDEE